MKNNNGMGIIQLMIIIIVIVFIIATSIHFVKKQYNEVRAQTIKTDMLQVQWKLKDYMNKQTVNGEEKQYLGTKISEITDDILISDFLTKNIISEEEYEKYYVLKDEDLSKAKLEITNYKDSYYLINYETYEVIVTQGCKYSKDEILYKLSDIENRTDKQTNTIDNTENEINTEKSTQ